MSRCMRLLCLPDEHYKRIRPKDGWIALAVIALIFPLGIVIFHRLPQDEYYIFYQMIFAMVCYILLFTILLVREQDVASMGFSSNSVPYMLLLTACLAMGFYGRAIHRYSIAGWWVVFAVAFAGLEEIVIRGFLYPRMQVLMGGSCWAAVITVLIGGGLYFFYPYLTESMEFWVIHGTVAGFLFHCIKRVLLLLVFTRSGNIVYSLLIHTLMEFSKSIPLLFYLGIVLTAAVLLLSGRSEPRNALWYQSRRERDGSHQIKMAKRRRSPL